MDRIAAEVAPIAKTLFFAAAFAVFALGLPAGAGADGAPPSSMYFPEALEMDSMDRGSYDDNGVEPNEPVTPGSGSVCPFPEDWTLDSTHWFSFLGTGGPVVVRLDGTYFFGMVLYQSAGVPTVEDGLECVRWPYVRRFEFNSVAGLRYLVQVGDWEQAEPELFSGDYRINLATPASNVNPAKAVALPLGTRVPMNNFGGTLDANIPHCFTQERNFFGGRSVWAKVQVPAIGTLAVDAEVEELYASLASLTMVELYRDPAAAPVTCAVGSFDPARPLSTVATAAVSPGTYWVHLMSAVGANESSEGSDELRWGVSASFTQNLDVDGDGHSLPSDCRDDDPAVHPGAIDIPDDGIDQNCDGHDERRDTDKDGVPDYKDRCPTRSSGGVDSDHNGCRDPERLQLVAQIKAELKRGRLHLLSLVVKTDLGARVALTCTNGVCGREVKRAREPRTHFGGSFRERFPTGTEVTIAATEAHHIGVSKVYRLSSSGLRLVRESCIGVGRRGKTVPCD